MIADTLERTRELARELKVARSGNLVDYLCRVNKLRSLVLSDDLKREIENAAYERAAFAVEDIPLDMFRGNKGAAVRNRAWVMRVLRALIQPPAQKENGE